MIGHKRSVSALSVVWSIDTSRFHREEDEKDEKENSPGRCDENKKENPLPRSALNNLTYEALYLRMDASKILQQKLKLYKLECKAKY